jgi:Raf kinase inhibitor-like YbhB/YbcL family protein
MAQSESPHLTTHSSGEPLAIQRVEPNERGGLIVTFPDLPPDGRIPMENSAYGDNISPAVGWTRVLEAETYALILQDPDAPQEEPFLHWMIWNIPGDAEGLPAGAGGKLPPDLAQGVQGKNAAGGYGYFGPKPPEGHGAHRYHFQVFALDDTLPADPDTSFNELMNMLKAHTLRHGEVIGTFERRERPDAPEHNRDATTYR